MNLIGATYIHASKLSSHAPDLTEFDFRPRLTSEYTACIAIKHPSQQFFSSSETLPPNLWDFYPTQSHEFRSCLATSSSAMEALGSPFRGPRWAGAMLSKYRKLVYADTGTVIFLTFGSTESKRLT